MSHNYHVTNDYNTLHTYYSQKMRISCCYAGHRVRLFLPKSTQCMQFAFLILKYNYSQQLMKYFVQASITKMAYWMKLYFDTASQGGAIQRK